MIKSITFLICLCLFLPVLQSQVTQLDALPNYSWDVNDAPKSFNKKLQFSFVRAIEDGFPSFGTVLAGGTYSTTQDGGAFQLYFPYNSQYGGTAPKIRLGKFNNQGWSDWETFYTSANANKSTIDWKANTLLVTNKIGVGDTDPVTKLDLGNNYSNPSTFPNKIALWYGGPNNYMGFGVSTGDLDYFSQSNHRFYTQYNGTPGTEKMIIKANGNIGVGTATPDMKLSVIGADKYISRFHTTDTESPMTGIRIGRKKSVGASYADLVNLNDGFGIAAGYSGGNLPLSTQNTSDIAIFTTYNNKNVGIGTVTPGAWKLAVNGNIRAKEIKVETGWSDFVFEKGYKLPTLQEVEEHIQAKGHLQDIPSAEEVAEHGIFLGQMDSKLLQKIEELMLYAIEQNKQIKVLQEKILSLEKKVQNQ